MKRVVVLVEGQTEEALVDEVLAPAALTRGVHLIPVVVITSATPTGARRGGGSWRHYDTRLHDEVSRLPFPAPRRPPRDRGARPGRHRRRVGEGLIPARGLTRLRREIARAGGPERIDHGPSTAPSKRLLRADPGYLKTVTGPLLVAEAGLSAVLARAPPSPPGGRTSCPETPGSTILRGPPGSRNLSVGPRFMCVSTVPECSRGRPASDGGCARPRDSSPGRLRAGGGATPTPLSGQQDRYDRATAEWWGKRGGPNSRAGGETARRATSHPRDGRPNQKEHAS